MDQSIENCLQIECRAGDDLEDVGCRRLLAQRLPQLIKQSRILHRDDRLCSEVFQKRDLFLAERPDLASRSDDLADKAAVLAQR